MMEELGYRPYGSYKDSHASWLGEVPSDWQVGPGRICIYENRDKNTGMKESTVLSLSYGRVIVKDEDKMTGLVPESYETYQIVQPGDIIIRGTDLQNDVTSLRTGLAKDHGIITSAYINLRPKPNAYAEFLHYLLHSYDVKKVFYGLGSGLRQNLSYVDFKYLTIPLPSLPEQRAIVAFLDDKCAKIEGAVKIKEDQIALLRERRQIIIQDAVTGGLNPAAPMKDSGIDWIGQIPAHWELKSIRYAFRFRNYQRVPISASDREGKQGEYPYYGASGIIDYVQDYIFDEDLILIAEDGANLLSKSTPLAFVATGKYWVNNHAHILEPLFPGFKYWAELLSAADYTVYISGSAQPKLTRDRLGSVRVPVPPADERNAIISFIEQESDKFRNAISIKERQIAALKEYKTSLINAAVTGKIKVI
jgi:type I restriction enzyme S subunit